jgi:TrmH family RNA methyltransferase
MLVKSKVKYIQTLGQKKFRNDEGLFIAEGPKIVKELIESHSTAITEVFALKEWIDENGKLLEKMAVTEIDEGELKKISQLVTPNKVLALTKQFHSPASFHAKDKVTLLLDNIQDPGNLGTIIRIADWFGVEQMICSPDCADLYNSKVIQATMGSISRVQIIYADIFEWLQYRGTVHLYATAMEGKDITKMEKLKEGILVIGNESKGVDAAVLTMADVKLTIPRKGNAESLNAAVATGIILSHLM